MKRMTTEPAAATAADLILHNGRIYTGLPGGRAFTTAVAVGSDGRVAALGERDALALRGPATRVVDLKGRTAVPGLNDSHIHVIRGGLSYNMELRWDGVTSLADALAMLREQAARTPAPQWVRVVGGWSEYQFKERRMPTLDEINAASPDTPVFVLHLYDRALLNKAALRAVGYTKENLPSFPGAEVQTDTQGNPTGLLLAKPNALILYATLAKGPSLGHEDQVNSTRHFLRELNRLGVTSIIDAGGGFQAYPEHYQVIEKLHEDGDLTLRIAYNLFPQVKGRELEDFRDWTGRAKYGQGDHLYRLNGAGEMLVFSAADFEDFLQPRPDLPDAMEAELERAVRHLIENRWPFRLHATYDESIGRMLDVFEKVNRDVPFDGLHWFFDHAETISDRNIERVAALGGGIAVQHRMAYQGEYFVDRYGDKAAERTPPVARMLEMGLPVGAGTDATRVASYNPWVALYWLTTGKTVGGLGLYPEKARLSREQALKLYTQGSAWFSDEQADKGTLAVGKLADVAVLSADYFTVPDEQVKSLASVLTVLGGRVVWASEEFTPLAPPDLPVSPDWSPVARYGGYGAPDYSAAAAPGMATAIKSCCGHAHQAADSILKRLSAGARGPRPVRSAAESRFGEGFFGENGCACWAF